METNEKLRWIDQVIYGLGVAVCIIIDAVIDAWHWLQCPAPGQLTVPVEDPNSLSSKIVQALGYAILGLAIAGFIYIWVFYPTR